MLATCKAGSRDETPTVLGGLELRGKALKVGPHDKHTNHTALPTHSTHNGRFCTYSSLRNRRLAKCATCDTPSPRHRATDLDPTFSEKLARAY
jgi:hypothetical protein